MPLALQPGDSGAPSIAAFTADAARLAGDPHAPAADRARAALTAAHLRADVVAAPDADAADRVDRRAVVLVTPGAAPDAAARAEALGTERGWSVVTAKPARCAEAVASLL